MHEEDVAILTESGWENYAHGEFQRGAYWIDVVQGEMYSVVVSKGADTITTIHVRNLRDALPLLP